MLKGRIRILICKGRIRIFNGVLSYETWMKKFTRKNFFIMGRSDTYLYLHFSSSSAPNQNVERSDSDFQRCPILWKQNILTIIWLIHSLGCFATKLELLENYLNSCQAYSRYLYVFPSLCLYIFLNSEAVFMKPCVLPSVSPYVT